MQNKKILILGLGAFGFAIAKHLGENNPHIVLHASEINTEIYDAISETRKHPYFFVGDEDHRPLLPDNIQLIANTEDFLPQVDIIISIIPCQFVGGAFDTMKQHLKNGVTILNLSKGIDNQSLQTTSEKLYEILSGLQYNYAYLAGGMIAKELVDKVTLGADIVTTQPKVGAELKQLFQSPKLDIKLKIGNVINTELAAACKNIIALILAYHEGQGAGASSLGYYFSKLLGEMQDLMILLQPTLKDTVSIDFTDYALSGDLIASCFGASRNRYLGNMLGKGIPVSEALQILKDENKIAEGYETLKGVYKIIKSQNGYQEIRTFSQKFL